MPSTQHRCWIGKAANLTYITISYIYVCVLCMYVCTYCMCSRKLCSVLLSQFMHFSVFSSFFYLSSLNKMEINWKEQEKEEEYDDVVERNLKLNQLTCIILTSRCMIPVAMMGQFILYLYRIDPSFQFSVSRSKLAKPNAHTPNINATNLLKTRIMRVLKKRIKREHCQKRWNTEKNWGELNMIELFLS